MLDATQLALLVAIDETSSLSQAAEKLSITQSAVSQMVKSIEKKLSFEVLYRHGKQMSLTPQGQKLVKFARLYIRRFDDILSEINDDQNKMVGQLSIGTLYGIGKSWIGHQLVDFCETYPSIKVSANFDFPHNLIDKFQKHQLDCLILPQSIMPSSFERLPLNEERSVLIYPPQHNFEYSLHSKDFGLTELSKIPLIFFEEHDPLFYRFCRERFGSIPRHIIPRLVINSFGHILQAVSSGLCVAVVPTHVINRSYFKDKIKIFSEGHEVLNDHFYFAFHHDAMESLKLSTLYEFLGKSIKLTEPKTKKSR